MVLFNLPDTSTTYWVKPIDTPEFFRHDLYRSSLPKGQILLILPYAYTGNSMIWQAQTRMYFDMDADRLSRTHWLFCDGLSSQSLTRRAYVPDAPEQLKAFIAAHNVEIIIVRDNLFRHGGRCFRLSMPSQSRWVTSGYTECQGKPYRTWKRPGFILRTSFDTKRLITLVTAAEKYLSEGGKLDSLAYSVRKNSI